MDEQQSIVNEFLIEAFESLDELDQMLVYLEENPADQSTINGIFRIIHTIKGTCGFLEFYQLETISHAGESLLDSVRTGRVKVDSSITKGLLKLVDCIRRILTHVEETGTEGEDNLVELVSMMRALSDNKDEEKEAEPQVEEEPTLSVESNSVEQLVTKDDECEKVEVEAVVKADQNEQPETVEEELDEFEALFQAARNEYEQSLREPEPENSQTQEDSDEATLTAETQVAQEQSEPEVSQETVVTEPNEPVKAVATSAPPRTVSAPTGGTEGDRKRSLSDTSLRVDVTLLDSLMNLVGELVLARNQILQFTKTQTDATFISTTHQLNLITSELQEGVMRTRMQPISNVWSKFPRVVRDIAHSCGKKVKIEMEGKETELDKTILEAIKDPLTHIVRNSVDHGIEDPDTRESNGKNPEGTLILKAFHEGGHVIIEISDDGAGINTEKVKNKVLEKGILSAEQLQRMGEQELANLIFLPGLTTAEQVTNISGRGVGMDVVRSNIEKIGGSVDLQSEEGAGTTLKVKIPLTLAIIPALLVETDNQTFAIPQVSLVELLRVEGEQLASEIEKVQGVHFYRLRGDLLPLIYLSEELKTSSVQADEIDQSELRNEESSAIKTDSVMSIVVIKVDEKQFGVVVDRVFDTEEIVVKPLGKQLNAISVFAGATILGDGRIALIVDVSGLSRSAGIHSDHNDMVSLEEKADGVIGEGTRQTLLLVQVGKYYRMAIPLDQVHRLEEFTDDQIELASGRELVQYRGGILPLVSLRGHFNQKGDEEESIRYVIVYSENGRSIGLVVDKILDIVEEDVVVNYKEGQDGISGSAIIQNKITDLLDVNSILRKADPSFFLEQRV